VVLESARPVVASVQHPWNSHNPTKDLIAAIVWVGVAEDELLVLVLDTIEELLDTPVKFRSQ
jgi:hypothetical protein